MMSTNRRGSPSTLSIPSLVVSSTPPITPSGHQPYFNHNQLCPQQQPCVHSFNPPPPATSNTNTNKPSKGQRLVQRAFSHSQSKLLRSISSLADPSACEIFDSTFPPAPSLSTMKAASTASTCTIDVLALIFRHLMDRKSILNCSLVSTHWHGPARFELARIVQDMPFNGLGLVHAIRMRFAQDTFPLLSMSQFDKHICDLSQLYYHSNPETKDVFAPVHAPDMLYHLFWTFLFIDQLFRHPKARPNVTCAYFVRLLQNDGGGYPRKYFDKKVLKSIYNDIRARPLLPAPHLIRSLQGAEGPLPNTGENTPGGSTAAITTPNSSTSSNSTRPTGIHSRQYSFMSLASSIRFEETIKRIRQWWKNVRDEGDQNQVGWVSHVDPPVTHTPTVLVSTTLADAPMAEVEIVREAAEESHLSATHGATLLATSSSPSFESPPSSITSTGATGTSTTSPLSSSLQAPSTHRERLSSSSTFPHGAVQSLDKTIRTKFGSKTELNLAHQRNNYGNSVQRWVVMNQGYTTVSDGWHVDGDGLDQIVSFPKPTKPSTHANQGHLIRCASVLDIDFVL